MWKLIKLEWKKNGIQKYLRNALIVFALLAVFMFAQCYLGIANDPETGVPDAASAATNNISSQVELLSGACFLVFSGVMLATFIVGAYKEKTINLMFSYPIKRQKIMISGMLAVWIFNFTALILCKFLLYMMLYVVSFYKESSFPVDYSMADPGLYIQLIAKSFVVISISFIALLIGQKLRSTKATIIASFLLFFLMNGTIGDFSLANNIWCPVVLMVISFGCAVLSLTGIETKDVQ